MDDGPVWRLSSDKWGRHAEHTQGSMVVLQHIIKQHWLLLWWTKFMEAGEEISAVCDKPLGKSGCQLNANKSTFAGASAGREKQPFHRKRQFMPFVYGLPSIGCRSRLLSNTGTKPLRYFEPWSQTHRYGGTFGTLLLCFAKWQTPKLGGKISERLTEWVHDFISPLSGLSHWR